MPDRMLDPNPETIVELVSAGPGQRVLDVTADGGQVALALARVGADVTVCQPTPEALDAVALLLAGHGLTVSLSLGEPVALPFADASFDAVTCVRVASRVIDPQALFAEAVRVLEPGGGVGFHDRVLPPEPTSAVLVDAFERAGGCEHDRALSAEGWRTVMERAGLAVEHSAVVEAARGFAERMAREGGPAGRAADLEALVTDGPAGVRRWLEPTYDEGRLVSYRSREIVALGRKPVDS